jgi:hypothetical protein
MKFLTFFFLTSLSKARKLWDNQRLQSTSCLLFSGKADSSLRGWIVNIDIVSVSVARGQGNHE